jgi:hypothetical protein
VVFKKEVSTLSNTLKTGVEDTFGAENLEKEKDR